MANAKIEWKINAAGRNEGDVEIAEIDTPFMRGCLANGRFVVLEDLSPKPEPVVDLPEPGAEGLVIPMVKPTGRRRARRETQFGETDLPLGNTD